MLVECDFDGTVMYSNLSVLIRENFAGGNWRQIEADYQERRTTVEQSNTLQYRLVNESREKLQEFVRQHIEVRSGFREFVAYCQQNGIAFLIVSSGLDFYIETVLAEIGMAHLDLYCAQTASTDDGIAVRYADPYGTPSTADSRRATWTDSERGTAPSSILVMVSLTLSRHAGRTMSSTCRSYGTYWKQSQSPMLPLLTSTTSCGWCGISLELLAVCLRHAALGLKCLLSSCDSRNTSVSQG